MISTSAEALLERYETMHALTKQMLDAARKSDWELLIELAQKRDAVEEFLRSNDTSEWQDVCRKRKESIIKEILALNTEITVLTQGRVSELREHIDSVTTEKKLNRAYK